MSARSESVYSPTRQYKRQISVLSPNHQIQPSGLSPNVDLAKMGEESFDVEGYVRNMLQKLPNEDSIQALQRTLADSKDLISQDLQKNVYQNYNEFVVISKEISKLEGDMISVRRVLNEIQEVRERFSSLGGDDFQVIPTEPVTNPNDIAKQRQRDELLVAERIKNMKAFYRDVDGLQKMLPENSNRQHIHDGSNSRIWDVNPNTYKQRDAVFIHILSDALIVAVYKKNIISGKNRLIVDKYFAIAEVGFIDMKDSPEMVNAFKILQGTDTFMYRAETLQEKRLVLGALAKLTGELVAQKKAELVIKPSKAARAAEQAKIDEDRHVSVVARKQVHDGLTDGDYRMLLEMPDELDVLIAQRDFGAAINMVEKGDI
jgi:exocyst complex component 8